MKTFEQFKLGYKASIIVLTEILIEGMTSKEILTLAERYPDCEWNTDDHIQSASCGYTTISRMETEEETHERAKVEYKKYVDIETQKLEIVEQMDMAQLRIVELEKQAEIFRQELAHLERSKKRLEDEVRGYFQRIFP